MNCNEDVLLKRHNCGATAITITQQKLTVVILNDLAHKQWHGASGVLAKVLKNTSGEVHSNASSSPREVSSGLLTYCFEHSILFDCCAQI